MNKATDFALDSTLGLALVGIFGVLWIAFGWYLGRKNKSHEDFALAGRNVGFALAAATAMATWVTSNTTLVAPQLTYQLGVWGHGRLFICRLRAHFICPSCCAN